MDKHKGVLTSFNQSPSFVLSSLLPFYFFCPVAQMETQEHCDCSAVRKMKTIRVPWIVPLSPSHCFCWWAMGTWQTMGMIGQMGGVWRRTGNREQETVSSRREKRCEHAETEGRLWSSCRNCGIETWILATQLKVRANRKFGCYNWKAFNNNPQTHTHTPWPLFRPSW